MSAAADDAMSDALPGSLTLVVDLDGTLLRSDLLHEGFWSALSHDWRTPFHALASLGAGRAALKRKVAGAAKVDVATLPYDQTVIAYIKDWRLRGGRTALVTASDQSHAQEIAGHLGLFDEVHGSDGKVNLKGRTKAALLAERFGQKGFAYIGDAAADLAVWQGASRVITVNAGQRLRVRAEALGKPTEHLQTVKGSLAPYLRALRPHQWLKNLLVFLPMLAAHRLDAPTAWQSVMAFVAFSLIASCVYLLNDLLDLRADRLHPRKAKRAIAAGALPIAHASAMMAALAVASLLLSAVLGWPFLAVILGYFSLTLAYSLVLKRWALIDICVLASLYTVRMIAGGAATDIPLSVWLLALSLFLFFSLAAVKRQAELVDLEKRGELKAAGRGYRVDDLPVVTMAAMASGFVSVLVLALYISSLAVVQLYSEPSLLWGICFVLLYWIARMIMVAHRGVMHDDPIVFAARDRVSQVCVLLAGLLAVGAAVL